MKKVSNNKFFRKILKNYLFSEMKDVDLLQNYFTNKLDFSSKKRKHFSKNLRMFISPQMRRKKSFVITLKQAPSIQFP